MQLLAIKQHAAWATHFMLNSCCRSQAVLPAVQWLLLVLPPLPHDLKTPMATIAQHL